MCILSHFKSCPTLCGPMDCSLIYSSVRGLLKGRILQWVSMSSSRNLSNPGINLTFLCLLLWQLGSLPLMSIIIFIFNYQHFFFFTPNEVLVGFLNLHAIVSEVAQSCLTLCDTMDCSPPGSYHPWNFLGKSTGVDCHLQWQ